MSNSTNSQFHNFEDVCRYGDSNQQQLAVLAKEEIQDLFDDLEDRLLDDTAHGTLEISYDDIKTILYGFRREYSLYFYR